MSAIKPLNGKTAFSNNELKLKKMQPLHFINKFCTLGCSILHQTFCLEYILLESFINVTLENGLRIKH